jgi:hypothetical protein
MFLTNGVRYKEIEPIVYIVVSAMFILNFRSFGFYFRRLSWHGSLPDKMTEWYFFALACHFEPLVVEPVET